MVSCGRLRWFGHLERWSVDDWLSICRMVEVAGAKCKGMNKKLGKNVWMMVWKCLVWILQGVFRDMWRDFIWINV